MFKDRTPLPLWVDSKGRTTGALLEKLNSQKMSLIRQRTALAPARWAVEGIHGANMLNEEYAELCTWEKSVVRRRE
ncbi:hypothetical protein RRG08_023786 [Elysia crispata]|uniref:Uncharacterized protein n=1 Tax=Elysia crispata TaxID=231223 RepID=A0AAE0ZVT3_9GAST|nr:hypothetical protein RRG08_023786 [Elysia crispata]